MSAITGISALDHATEVAHTWVKKVSGEFGTTDEEFAYRVLRGWLHTLRDRLTVEAAARFAAQLPDLIRGVFYAGWDPGSVPVKYHADGPDGYAARFSREATIAVTDVAKAAAATTSALRRLLPDAQVDKALDQLPDDVRRLLDPDPK